MKPRHGPRRSLTTGYRTLLLGVSVSSQLYAEAEDLEVLEESDDEMNANKRKIKIRFKLNKGSYATEYIKPTFE